MALAQEDIDQIQWLIKKVLSETPETLNANVRYELDLRERTIRVEEELKHQRELMVEGFKQMDKRFEQIDKRFEQIDKRFEQVEKRLDQVDKRFEQQHQEIMGLHHEIKLLMRWSFGTLLAIGGLIVAVLRLAQ
ncbi:hypothetical protein ABXJ76_01130 [Methylobacter sp. G7]|uniref:hypothetical protein n=1 Tax=Methylobacter sp. G7 TaxID=3230117 RepID=UPI003D803ED2